MSTVTGAPGNGKRPARVLLGVFVLGAVIFCILLRCIHLGADTPDNMANNPGLYIDEGYKTLKPRNLVLFDSTVAHPADDYKGWLKTSPLTNWPYYIMFKGFGVELANARLVTVAYFGLFIGLFVAAMAGRYSPGLLLAGVLAFSVQHTLFFYSRVALLEVPMAAFLYGGLFLFVRGDSKGLLKRLILLAVVVLVCFFAVKKSVLLYFFAAGGLGVVAVMNNFSLFENKSKVFVGLAGFTLIAVVAAFLTYDVWGDRVEFSALSFVSRALYNPLAVADSFLGLAALLCGLHGLLCRPQDYLENVYRASLLGLVFLTPVIIAVFPYNPTRYYVPVISANILLVLEWTHLRSWKDLPARHIGGLSKLLVFFMLLFFFFYAGIMFNQYVLKNIPVNIGQAPGLSNVGIVRFFAPAALLAAVVVFFLRRRLFSGRIVSGSLLFVVCMGFVFNIFILRAFIFNPSYKSSEISAKIETLVAESSIVAGDWAPFFLVDTKIRALYMNNAFNRENVDIIRPDYFIDSDNWNCSGNIRALQEVAGARLGKPALQSEYAGSEIRLYPVLYHTDSDRPDR